MSFVNTFVKIFFIIVICTNIIFASSNVTNFTNETDSPAKGHIFKEFVAARQVYVYRAYKDLQIFHFTLPPHLSKAVFNLTSNNTDGCLPRNITVYLQADSFPLVSPDGAKYPEKSWTSRQPLYHATLLSNLDPVLLTVEAPQPGDWFMVGFIFDDSNRITQAGLFPSCYAWLQVDASYHQEDDIEILNTHVIVNETSFLPYNISDFTYFSFFVPSQVWKVTVVVKNCRLLNDSLSDSLITNDTSGCPLGLQLRPSALPFDNAPNVINGNCSASLDDFSCSLSFTPKESAWHYLSVAPWDSAVAFEIGVSFKICGFESDLVSGQLYYYSLEKEFIFQDLSLLTKVNGFEIDPSANGSSSTKVGREEKILVMTKDAEEPNTIEAQALEFINPSNLMQPSLLLVKREANFTGLNSTDLELINSTFLNETIAEDFKVNLTEISLEEIFALFLKDPGCWPRHELMRKTFPGNFVFEFDLKPDANGTVPLMLNLSNHNPTVLSYDLQPIIDIGGTLMVDIAISPFMNTSSHNYSVHACLNYGLRSAFVERNGSLGCDRGEHLLVHTGSIEHFSGSALVPYPEPGRWFLTLFPSCFKTNQSESVLCTSNFTTIIFSIASSSCIMGKCGTYGTCYQMITGGFIFSTCVCDVGYRGYGCTDGSEAIPNWKLLLSTLLLCLSNLFFLPAIILALYRRYLTEALIYTFTMFFSTFYHACDQEVYSICLMRLSVLQFCDFYSAILSFWVTLIVMANLPPTLYSLLHMAGAVVVALGVEYDRTGLWVFAIPSISAFIIMAFAWMVHSKKNKACYPPQNYWIRCLLPGTVLAAVGLICYAFLETEDNYYVIHSFWHAIMALSILCLLPHRRAKKGHLFDMNTDSNDEGDAQASDSQALTVNLNL